MAARKSNSQPSLALQGGSHAGPLFIVNKIRPPIRIPGKEGEVHRAQQAIRTPAWVDKGALRVFYREAKRLTKETGEQYVVDHIVPKVGQTVSGLHVPWNLQVMHWLPNAQKGSNWWPDMWGEQLPLL